MQALSLAKMAGVRLKAFQLRGYVLPRGVAADPEFHVRQLCAAALSEISDIQLSFNDDQLVHFLRQKPGPSTYAMILNCVAERLEYLKIGFHSPFRGDIHLEFFCGRIVLPALRSLCIQNYYDLSETSFERFLRIQVPDLRKLPLKFIISQYFRETLYVRRAVAAGEQYNGWL